MKSIIDKMEPELVWQHFYNISQIPRCSGHEEQIGKYVISVAGKNQLSYKKDEVGNIIITVPPHTGYEKLSSIVLQGHLDMVCEKNKTTDHDFSKDPLKLKINEEWLSAEGTTLGADNGIGISYLLALMDDRSIIHGPLECLFTVDEETGLTGATDLKPGFIKSRYLINSDSEEEGEIYIGCAGGQHTILRKKIDWQETPSNCRSIKVKISGLRGGHSGLNIHQGLGNSIKLLGRILYNLGKKFPFYLSQVDGGSKHNAIPREAEAIITISNQYSDQLNSFIKEMVSVFKNELQYTDKNIIIHTEDIPDVTKIFSSDFQKILIRLLYVIPHGVISMSPVIEGLVETSTNMAIVNTKNDSVELLTSQRSSIKTSIIDIAYKIKALGELSGFEVEEGGGYAPWQPNPDSELLKLAVNIFKELEGKEPLVKAVHAGLECGIIGEKFPGMDMISIGPTILGAHSPEERVHIPSVENVWNYLLELLKRI